MNLSFVLAVALLLVIVLFVLLWPLLRPRRPEQTTRQVMNAAICREQLRELESDLKAGNLTQAAFDEAQLELRRRLLAESGDEDEPTAKAVPPRAMRTALVLVILLPLASAGLYAWLGNPDAMKPGLSHQTSAGEMDKMVEALAARLEKNPDDLRGWAMLARSYKAMKRFDDAGKAFARLGDAINEDATLLASYADLLAVQAGGNIEGKPLQLIGKALELEPDHSMALSLAGTAAYNRKDFATAVKYWERLLKTLAPDSEDAKGVADAIARLREEHKLGSAPAAVAKGSKPAAGAPVPLKGRVELARAAEGKVAPTDVVFIIARPAEGGRMPLAARRLTVAELPVDFALDDSLAMMSGVKLSEAKQIVVEARVSKSGDVKPAPGDWTGQSKPVKPDASGVRVVIDRQLP